MQRIGLLISLVAILALVTGCTTGLSNKALGTVNPDIKISDLFDDPYGIEGETVLFGGVIASNSNYLGQTSLEVMEYPLDTKLAPDTNGISEGTILVRFKTFLSQEEYRPGKLVTIIGTVAGAETRRFGPNRTTYPVVDVVEHQLRLPSESIVPSGTVPVQLP